MSLEDISEINLAQKYEYLCLPLYMDSKNIIHKIESKITTGVILQDC